MVALPSSSPDWVALTFPSCSSAVAALQYAGLGDPPAGACLGIECESLDPASPWADFNGEARWWLVLLRICEQHTTFSQNFSVAFVLKDGSIIRDLRPYNCGVPRVRADADGMALGVLAYAIVLFVVAGFCRHYLKAACGAKDPVLPAPRVAVPRPSVASA
jgi:hypothetical protein